MIWCLGLSAALAWDERGMDGVPTGRTIDPSAHFEPLEPGWSGLSVFTAPLDLGLVAAHTADTLRRLRYHGEPLCQPQMLGELGVSIDDVIETLDLVARTAFEDRGRYEQRLQDPAWLAEHFEGYRWLPDRQGAEERNIELDQRLRLTKYVVYEVDGSPVATDTFDTPLYGVPHDERGGSPARIRNELTRMDVYDGVFLEGGRYEGLADPLVWLTREASNQALLQGTVLVKLPDGSGSHYNVHLNNGRAWDPAQKNLDLQPRFWYFRPVDAILGVEAIPLRPQVVVAGDIYNVGLGKLIAIEWPTPTGTELRLAVLADTGGAFQPNLFQLDYLAGTFPSYEAYVAWAEPTPSRVTTTVLVRRQ